jgi:type IV pilus assembly protein PilB
MTMVPTPSWRPAATTPRLGELLVGDGQISGGQLQQALNSQVTKGGRLGSHLLQMGLATEQTITGALSRQAGVPWIDLADFAIDPAIVSLVRPETAWKYGFVPVSLSDGTLTVAIADPSRVMALDDVKFTTGYGVDPILASDPAVERALEHYYPGPGSDVSAAGAWGVGAWGVAGTLEMASRGLEELQATLVGPAVPVDGPGDWRGIGADSFDSRGEHAPVVRLVNVVLMSAVQKRASDIHIEPYEKELRVRYRVDGTLHTVITPPLTYRDAIASRVKIMAGLDIAERRLPQDGRITVRFDDNGRAKAIDFRVSVLPTLFGEKIVLRLLDRDQLRLEMTSLGFEPESLARFESAILRPWGMVLVTGPTGSGKTNTLYSCIARLNTPATNIVTAEDPVEFNFAGVNQVQIRESQGLGFAAALRSFLRQDPNIILLGEIRDAETAGIAVKAALTGRLVLSTLHTNDAPSAIARLTNMGVEPFLVGSSVHLVCAQRLVRCICAACARPHPLAAAILRQAGFSAEDAATVRPSIGAGCSKCQGTGYKGRIGVYEVMVVSEMLRALISDGAPAHEVRRQAVAEGMITLRESGLVKVKNGVATLEDVIRETVH